jgi:hypothetical protein
VTEPLLGTKNKQEPALAGFSFCAQKVKHLRALRQDSKGIRYYGCRGRVNVTEPLLGTKNKQEPALAGFGAQKAKHLRASQLTKGFVQHFDGIQTKSGAEQAPLYSQKPASIYSPHACQHTFTLLI